MLNIARTSDRFQNRFGKLFRSFGLTGSQHNVLRIVRGEGRPIRCDEIRQRMNKSGTGNRRREGSRAFL
jgi:hypothetical protein